MRKRHMIELTADDGFSFSAFEAKHEQPRAGIICVMEAFGLNGAIKAVAEGYAAEGYHVLAPALYDRLGRHQLFDYDTQLSEAVEAMTANGFDNPLLDVAACAAHLKSQGVERIGIVGYCYGGTISWLAASRLGEIHAASCYYGSAIPMFPEDHPQCPTLAHWGKSDPSTPEDKVAEVAAQNPQVTMHWYEAGHGFNSRDRQEHFNQAAAAQALQRTLAFFADNL